MTKSLTAISTKKSVNKLTENLITAIIFFDIQLTI